MINNYTGYEEGLCFLPIQEEWRAVVGYDGMYEVSNYGRVKSLDRTITDSRGMVRRLKGRTMVGGTTLGYPTVNIREGNNKMVHRLVAESFIGPRPIREGVKYVVDHIDEVKTNNHVSNLRYVTFRENVTRSKKGKTSQYRGVSWNKQRGKWEVSMHRPKEQGKKHLGCYITELEAHHVYEAALKEHLDAH